MRKFFTGIFLLALCAGYAQHGMNYQAVLRDVNNELIKNQIVEFEITLQGINTILYQESHVVTTDDYGQVALVIGSGTPIQGQFWSIRWADYEVTMKVDLSYEGTTVTLSDEGFQYVPYAYGANKSWQANFADSARAAQTADSANAFRGDYLKIGTASSVNQYSHLTIEGDESASWGGVYVNMPSTSNGKPFYGYAIDGNPIAYNYYDPVERQVVYYSGGNTTFRIGISGPVLTGLESGILATDANGVIRKSSIYETNGTTALVNSPSVVLNGTSSVNSATHLTVHSQKTGYGGMYINSTENTGVPFYGYAVGGSPKAWTYYQTSTENLSFYNGGDRIVANSAGLVGVNTSLPKSELHVKQRSSYSQGESQGLRIESYSGTYVSVGCGHVLNDVAFTFSSSGSNSIVAGINGVTGAYLQVSDARYKKDIKDLDHGIESVMRLEPKEYVFKESEDVHQFGFLAQDLLEVFPTMVSEYNGKYTVDYNQFSALAIKAIQDQQNQIEELTDLVKLLQHELAQIK